MARGMNHVYLIGALARDPELRYTPSGTAVFEATVAGEDHIVGNDGRERKLPWYHRVSILGKPAEWQAERNLKGGDAVMVEGSLEYSQWEAPEGGKRSMVRVKALRMEQLGYAPELVQDAGGGVRMGSGMNEVVMIGNVTRDPELRYTPAGDAVLGLGLAVNETWNDRQGQKQEKTHWIDITLWRDLAERMKDLKKGDPVLVQGRLVNEAWTDRDGNKRNSTKVEATRVESLSRGAGTPNSGYAAATPAGPRPQTASSAARPQSGGYGQPSRAATQGNRSGGLDIDQGLDDFPPEEEDLPF
ncbi:single-stranded DNA-binding protein [Deinococcus gobiensis]|uniref:Single-stranded DNA-binding protein n=1 Tax=Deinococcus gobiensis (strain DSM 21396 / JCM 16679 / CGMCC 1.7299 / I-0) TaxID=745776 RepID=H8GSU7_DEIGI|nr:single-stranded DNA-binding protein [Deinococcus gobiensis]AFD24053.1 Single-stranded DNA-binding protein [Deinococcus gobiensis I-0]